MVQTPVGTEYQCDKCARRWFATETVPPRPVYDEPGGGEAGVGEKGTLRLRLGSDVPPRNKT
jgi:hypothetical protein